MNKLIKYNLHFLKIYTENIPDLGPCLMYRTDLTNGVGGAWEVQKPFLKSSRHVSRHSVLLVMVQTLVLALLHLELFSLSLFY